MLKRLTPLLIITIFVSLPLSGCTDITKSSKYKTYDITYLANTTNIDTANIDGKLEDLKTTILGRLNKFNVTNVSTNLSKENNSDYLKLKFGTIDDINDIKKTLDKNTLLTFKKQFKDESDYETDLTMQAKATLEKLKNNADFETTAQNEVLKDPARIVYIHSDFMYRDEIKDVFADKLFNMEPGDMSDKLIEYSEQASPLAPPVKIKAIVKLFDKRDKEKVTKHNKTVDVSHILIAYKGAMRASDSISRTQDEAKALANELVEKLNNGEDFAKLAKEYSDDASNSKDGGVLETPAGNKTYVEQFENAALALNEENQISPVTETPFGYHIIKANKVTSASEESDTQPQVKFGILFYALVPSQWQNIDFDESTLASVETRYDESYNPYLILHFNNKGKEEIQQITNENNGNVIGIFVGNKLITSFTVKETNSTGIIKILKPDSTKEADELKELLLTKPLPLPLILQDSQQV